MIVISFFLGFACCAVLVSRNFCVEKGKRCEPGPIFHRLGSILSHHTAASRMESAIALVKQR